MGYGQMAGAKLGDTSALSALSGVGGTHPLNSLQAQATGYPSMNIAPYYPYYYMPNQFTSPYQQTSMGQPFMNKNLYHMFGQQMPQTQQTQSPQQTPQSTQATQQTASQGQQQTPQVTQANQQKMGVAGANMGYGAAATQQLSQFAQPVPGYDDLSVHGNPAAVLGQDLRNMHHQQPTHLHQHSHQTTTNPIQSFFGSHPVNTSTAGIVPGNSGKQNDTATLYKAAYGVGHSTAGTNASSAGLNQSGYYQQQASQQPPQSSQTSYSNAHSHHQHINQQTGHSSGGIPPGFQSQVLHRTPHGPGTAGTGIHGHHWQN
jgi:hypothetical protein